MVSLSECVLELSPSRQGGFTGEYPRYQVRGNPLAWETPKPEGFVGAARYGKLAIRSQANGTDGCAVSLERGKAAAIGQSPQLDALVGTARQNIAAIGAQGN